MKISIIMSLINNELNIEKIRKSLLDLNEQTISKEMYEVLILTSTEDVYNALIEEEVNKLEGLNIKIKHCENTDVPLINFEEDLTGDYVMVINGGDRVLKNTILSISKQISEEQGDIYYLRYNAPNYKIRSKAVKGQDYGENLFKDTVLWEAVNNKLIKSSLIKNNKISLDNLINDEDKILVFTDLLLNAQTMNVLNAQDYLKLQGNDDEYLMFEDHGDDAYLAILKSILNKISSSNKPDDEKNILKAGYFGYELLYGQNCDKLKDINKEEDKVKQEYLEKLVSLLGQEHVEVWAKDLSIEAQGIVRVMLTENLVNVANNYNQLALYNLYETHKKKTDRQLYELNNTKNNEREKVSRLLEKNEQVNGKLSDLNDMLSKLETVNQELRLKISSHEKREVEFEARINLSNEKANEYREKLVQAKELFTEQELSNTELKGKVNEQKVLVQEKNIEISRLNIELEYLKTALEGNEQVLVSEANEQVQTIEQLNNNKAELEQKVNELDALNKQYQDQLEQIREIKEGSQVSNEVKSKTDIEVRCAKLERENQILRAGYDDLANKLKLNKNIFSFLKR